MAVIFSQDGHHDTISGLFGILVADDPFFKDNFPQDDGISAITDEFLHELARREFNEELTEEEKILLTHLGPRIPLLARFLMDRNIDFHELVGSEPYLDDYFSMLFIAGFWPEMNMDEDSKPEVISCILDVFEHALQEKKFDHIFYQKMAEREKVMKNHPSNFDPEDDDSDLDDEDFDDDEDCYEDPFWFNSPKCMTDEFDCDSSSIIRKANIFDPDQMKIFSTQDAKQTEEIIQEKYPDSEFLYFFIGDKENMPFVLATLPGDYSFILLLDDFKYPDIENDVSARKIRGAEIFLPLFFELSPEDPGMMDTKDSPFYNLISTGVKEEPRMYAVSILDRDPKNALITASGAIEDGEITFSSFTSLFALNTRGLATGREFKVVVDTDQDHREIKFHRDGTIGMTIYRPYGDQTKVVPVPDGRKDKNHPGEWQLSEEEIFGDVDVPDFFVTD